MNKQETLYTYEKLVRKYNLEKLDILKVELFEIVNKYQKYRHSSKKWYLRPLYEIAYVISNLIALSESRYALLN